jgi:hypothetical protein
MDEAAGAADRFCQRSQSIVRRRKVCDDIGTLPPVDANGPRKGRHQPLPDIALETRNDQHLPAALSLACHRRPDRAKRF